METNNDNGIARENEELIERLAGIIRKDKESRAIDAMVSEAVNATDFSSIPVGEQVYSPYRWVKYAAVAAAVIVLGVFAVRMVNENRKVTSKSESIAMDERNSVQSHSSEEAPVAETTIDSTTIAMAEQEPEMEAVPGEPAQPKSSPASHDDEVIAMAESSDRTEMSIRPPSPPASYGTGVENIKEKKSSDRFVQTAPSIYDNKSNKLKPTTESTSNYALSSKPGSVSPGKYSNMADSQVANIDMPDLAKMDKNMAEEEGGTRSLNFNALSMKTPAKNEISQYIIKVTDTDIDAIKNKVIGVLQSFGFGNLNVSEKEYYIEIKTPAAQGYSNNLQKNVGYSIEVKINNTPLNKNINVKLLNLGIDSSNLLKKISAPIEDFFNKSLKSSLNTKLNK